MKSLIKKINALFLLLPGIIPLLFIISFSLQQYIIHYRMKEKLEKQLLQTITIPDKDIQWIEKDEEILVNGKMFDISTIEHQHEITLFTGLFDHEETALILQLEKTQKQNPLPGNKLLADFFQWLQSAYSDNYHLSDLVSNYTTRENPIIVSALSEQFKTIITPPPQGI